MDFASPGRAAALSPPARGLFDAAGGGTPALLRLPQLAGDGVGIGAGVGGVGGVGATPPRGFTPWRAAAPAAAWCDWWAAPPGALLRSASTWSLGDGLARAPSTFDFSALAASRLRATAPPPDAFGLNDAGVTDYWSRASSASAQARARAPGPRRAGKPAI
jgi:hypothetical protein